MNRQVLVTVFLAFLFACFSGCDIINPDQKEPAYLEIDTFSFDNSGYGMSIHRITDVWVYVNSKFIGTYELPAKRIPIIPNEDGSPQTVWLYAGVYTDGIRSQRVTYPFYSRSVHNVSFIKGQTTKLIPSYKFSPTSVLLQENFEGVTVNIVKGKEATVPLQIVTNNDNYPENQVQYAMMKADKDSVETFQIMQEASQTIPLYKPTYLEMSYKCSVPIGVGIYVKASAADSTGQYNYGITLNATPNQWKRVYVYLGEEMYPESYSYATGSVFQFVIVGKSDGLQQHFIAVDNLRLVQM